MESHYNRDVEMFLNEFSNTKPKGIPVNQRDDNGATMLMHYSYEGDYDTAEVMIKAGAFVNMQAYNGVSALMAAAGAGNDDIMELLLSKGASMDQMDKNGDRPLDFAMNYKYFDTACTLIYIKPFNNELKSYNNIKYMEVAKCILASGNIVKFHLSSFAPYLGKNIISYAESIYADLTEENSKYRDRLDEVEIYRGNPVQYILKHHLYSKLALKSISSLESQGYSDPSIDKVKECLQPIGFDEDLASICGDMALTEEL
jgi:hypothetical protein